MTSEVYAPCPQCRETIPFYQTVDQLKKCPECGTPKDELFEIAQSPSPDDVEAAPRARTDGGIIDE